MDEFIHAIDQGLKGAGDRVVFLQSDQSWTVDEASFAVDLLAQWLKRRCKPGDRVAALSRNAVEVVLLEWAAYRLGCIWIGIPARERTATNVEGILSNFKPRLLVLDRNAAYGDSSFPREVGQEIAPPPGLDRSRFRALWREKPPGREPHNFEVGREGDREKIQIQRLRYSSGSTGESKAVAYSNGTSFAILQMIRELIVSKGTEEAVVHALPMTWASGSLIAPALCEGRKTVLLESWDVRKYALSVAQEKSVLTFLTPGLVAELVRFSQIHGAGWAHSLKRVLVAGGPLPVYTLRRASVLFPKVEFLVTLGMTEASFPITLHQATADDTRPGSSGPSLVPLGRLTDTYKKGGSKPNPETNELLIAGGALAAGIWQPSQGPGASGTLEALSLYASGDLVAEIANGVLHYRGRKSTPWTSDRSVPPPDAIEAVVNECPGVRRCLVDWLQADKDQVVAHVRVQPEAGSLDVRRVEEFFDQHRDEACLSQVRLEGTEVAPVELTLSGKVLRVPRKPEP